jgi:uncharacterized delta-60 repeat protein
MPLLADRVKETTTTTGTGQLTLAGAPTGFQSFTTAFGNGASVYYVIAGGAQWEIGIGTTGAGTLTRETVLQSTNADALVDFVAGVKDVFCSYVADRAVTTSDTATLTNKTIDSYTNDVGANSTHFRIKAGETLAKGDVIRAVGFTPGENAIEVVKVASASEVGIGICEQALNSGQFGMAVVIGELLNVNTNGFTVNETLYSNGAGGFTATKPSSGLYQVLGWVVRANVNNGVIAVNVVSPLYVEASTNTANTAVIRDGSGNFAAGTITAALTGNASTATTLQTARNINGVSFNGSADITIPTGVFQSVNISPTVNSPYVITATDIGKRLVTNTVAPTLAWVQLTATETAAMPNGSAVQIAAWTGNVNIDLLGTFDRGIAEVNSEVLAVARQSDGKILIGGFFSSVGGVSRPNLARLNADGTLDTTFAAIDTGGVAVFAIAVQSDGKVIIGGTFTTVNGNTRNYIARLNADGTLDTGYNPNCGARVRTIALQSDGKSVIGGDFTTVGGSSRNYLARLNTNGTVDTASISPSGIIECVVIQPDQKILIGGVFTDVGGTSRNYVARLNANFTVDTFNPNSGSTVFSMAVQSDGKVLLAGQFTTMFGTTQNYIARANADGTRDTTFSTTGANNSVLAVAIESDGKIVAGGNFTAFGGSTRSYFARLSATGALEAYNPALNAGVSSRCLVVQPDGKILVGGQFTSISGVTARPFFARLNPTAGAPIVIRAPYSAGTQYNRYTVVTVEKMDATTWWITESNAS